MKTVFNLFLSLLIVSAVVSSCSTTRNAVGIDTINGFIRTGKWTSLTTELYAPGSNTAIKTDLLTDGKYLEFKSDNKAHIYNASGTEVSSANYRFIDTKTILYEGIEFKIRENFVSTITTMTLVNESTAGKTIYTFRR